MKLLTALALSVAALFASPALASAAPGNQPSNETFNNAPYAAASSDGQNPGSHGQRGMHGKRGLRGQQAHQGQRGRRGQQAHQGQCGQRGQQGQPGQQGQRGQKRKMIKLAMLQRFDRNGDRRLDPSERAAIKASFDTNRDGKIDRNERRVLKQTLRPAQPPAQPQRPGPAR
ncbi:MAG: hypothetical protein KBG15_24625 [Kofleriaceae bacterium]|nr:hypothetical protein [Kofleriaceae bacterium]